ncbi:hypothetical protein MCOR25_000951 [Pyricularia grisea]|uniref:Calcium channel YVC1-like C-terminal transmembrane domain-containing protein n=1 Tax=Pyricularia grisea TaxID=148305 RepID=A0A6P8BLQ7_PYRGI|nr:uncharacterized protein PgNI_01753 [Pyricularia grisea]KAI6382074.1 hypothetical protein MCOR25_000951 [Pyricularia grisea]TLD17537.1 hypothetical protein PgNI_01753 [Pyricularia grisea]
MPLRVKSKPAAQQANSRVRSPSPIGRHLDSKLPDIEDGDSFRELTKKLSVYIAAVVRLPYTFEQLRTTAAGEALIVLVQHLSTCCKNPAIVNSLLALKWHYGVSTEDKGIAEARANACEIVAWRFLTHLSEREAVEYCLYEIPDPDDVDGDAEAENGGDEENGHRHIDENTTLLPHGWSGNGFIGSGRIIPDRPASRKRYQLLQSLSSLTMSIKQDDDEDEEHDPTAPFKTLNGLEIAAVADAKRFLSQTIVQKIITGIWEGDIVFWEDLTIHSVKRPKFYKPHTADPFSRLRVPKYLKSFEVLFFLSFLCLYYAVLNNRDDSSHITTLEAVLYVWFAAFFYDELSEWIDAGSIFYATDVWNLFDMVMLLIGIAFVSLRVVGLYRGDQHLTETAFDILSLEALFMVPRICSVLSLSPYWGTLIPCLKEMGKDFVKFMVLVVIVYLGFLTTFSQLARHRFGLANMTMFLTKIFFGSSYVGFDIMRDIDPVFGPPLMLTFITLSSILLMGSLTGMLSNSFSRVISHAREEYLYVYSVYVLEASTSNRLTHFYPPFNLIALIIFRPLRLFLPSDHKFRAARIALLKATHWPIVGVIQVYELIRGKFRPTDKFRGPVPDSLSAGASPRKTQKRPALQGRRSGSSLNDPSPWQRQQPRTTSGAEYSNMQQVLQSASQSRVDMVEDTGMAGPTDVEVRISELSNKIDKLTDLVLAMQNQQALQTQTTAQVSV